MTAASRKRTRAALLLTAMVFCHGAADAQSDDKRAAREREALRRSQQALRTAQDEALRLQAEKTKLESQAAALKAEADKHAASAQAEARSTRGALAKAQAEVVSLKQELEALKAAQAQERTEAQAKVDGLTARLAQAQRSLAERMEASQSVTTLLDNSIRALGQAEDKNRELVDLNRKLITLYRDKGVRDALAQKEPVFGLRQVAVENEAEALRTQVEALRLPQTPSLSPAPTGAGGR